MDMAYEARRAMDGHFIGKADCKIGYGMYENLNLCVCVFENKICLLYHDETQLYSANLFLTYIDLIILEISM